ncbi:hypothetical protein B0H13DRAFT_1862988 [Mycena leptocephala]|nr:hypothetical protein B0H13DRAFT_1862988 [Mycena leptocephala]
MAKLRQKGTQVGGQKGAALKPHPAEIPSRKQVGRLSCSINHQNTLKTRVGEETSRKTSRKLSRSTSRATLNATYASSGAGHCNSEWLVQSELFPVIAMGSRAAIWSISNTDILDVYGPPKEDPDAEPKHQTRDAGYYGEHSHSSNAPRSANHVACFKENVHIPSDSAGKCKRVARAGFVSPGSLCLYGQHQKTGAVRAIASWAPMLNPVATKDQTSAVRAIPAVRRLEWEGLLMMATNKVQREDPVPAHTTRSAQTSAGESTDSLAPSPRRAIVPDFGIGSIAAAAT